MNGPDHETTKLRRILDVTRQMAALTDHHALLDLIVHAACDVLACERATIFLHEPATRSLTSHAATGGASIRVPDDRGIVGVAATERCIVNVPDAYRDPRFNPEVDRQTGFKTRNLLTFPLENLAGELMGVLQALNRADRPFDAADEDLARVLAAQAGVALHRERLLAEFTEKQRMARDLELARSIQRGMLPGAPPQVPGYDVAGWNDSADETGGDCYDFLPLADGRLAILLADASGHGIGAALVIAQCRAALRALLPACNDLGTSVARVNALLEHDLGLERFVTAFVGVLNPAEHRLDYVSAGQGPVLFATDNKIESRVAGGIPLGIDAETLYEAESFIFAPGDRLVLLTDGFYETANEDGTLFGQQRVRELLTASATRDANDLIEALRNAVASFADGRPPADDLTAVVIRRLP